MDYTIRGLRKGQLELRIPRKPGRDLSNVVGVRYCEALT